MKKVISGLFICAALVAFTSCKKEKKVNCTQAVESFTAKWAAYLEDDTVDNCNAVKTAAGQLDESCFASLSTEIKDMLEDLDCSPR